MAVPPVTSSHDAANKALDDILLDFEIDRQPLGSLVRFVGDIPKPSSTSSQMLNLSLIGSIPALANAVAATQIYEVRGGQAQTIEVDLRRGHNYLDPDTGMTPTLNGQEISLNVVAGNPFLFGIYKTRDAKHVVPSAVYVDLVYQWSIFLNCAVNAESVGAAIALWNSKDLERAAERAGLPFAVIQSEESWAATPQGKHMSALPIVPVRKVGTAPAKPLSANPSRPLEGVKVICATHAIAGPSAGRTLAEHGATVLQVMYTHGFEHDFVYTYANLGSSSTRLDFEKPSDKQQMWELVSDADVWIDSYREGALTKFGFTDTALLAKNPNLIISHVRVYGTSGPWSSKPGFDMQGSASSGMMACCGDGPTHPRWPPGQVMNDYTTGYFGALAIQSALLRRMREGGGYVVSPSLTGTAMAILSYFKTVETVHSETCDHPAMPPLEAEFQTPLGLLKTLKPLPVLDRTPMKYDPVVLEPIGSSVPGFRGHKPSFRVEEVDVTPKEEVVRRSKERGEQKSRVLKVASGQSSE